MCVPLCVGSVLFVSACGVCVMCVVCGVCVVCVGCVECVCHVCACVRVRVHVCDVRAYV